MIQRSCKCKSVRHKSQVYLWVLTGLIILMFNVSQAIAQDTSFAEFTTAVPATTVKTRELFGGKITNSGYGGVILKFSSFNDQFAFMTGGRGAITINNRYTIGGGGYGKANSINIPGSGEDITRLFKMGYGGIEMGYILLPGKKMNIGGSLLIAAGAAFWQNKPKSNGENLFDDASISFRYLSPHCTAKSLLTASCGFTQASATGMFTMLIWIT